MRNVRALLASCVVLFLVCALVGPAAAHAQGGKSGITGSLQLDQAAPARGQWITFTWSVQNMPAGWDVLIEVECAQAGVVVYERYDVAYYGFFELNWPSGGADCTAVLYVVKIRPTYNTNQEEPTKNNTLAVVHFAAAP